MTASFAFDQFVLDTRDRRLRAGGELVELNSRYFDALTLLVRDQGQLVPKKRFMAEVWRGIPVTDEALTQCIRTLRRQLGDDAANPRFIETVPKHGYRFVAQVKQLDSESRATTANALDGSQLWRHFWLLGAAGTAGGTLAGVIGGLVYGFAAASQSDVGALSTLAVLLCVTVLVAAIGGAGVSFAIATAAFARPPSWQWMAIAGAGGGLLTGAVGKLLGLDAFDLLVGRSLGNTTGATEGLVLGGAVGIAAWLGLRIRSLPGAAALAGLSGALAGIAITLLGGRLMLGSLALLTQGFPGSRLQLDRFGHIFGERDFGPVTQIGTASLEGALFACSIVTAMAFAGGRYSLKEPS